MGLRASAAKVIPPHHIHSFQIPNFKHYEKENVVHQRRNDRRPKPYPATSRAGIDGALTSARRAPVVEVIELRALSAQAPAVLPQTAQPPQKKLDTLHPYVPPSQLLASLVHDKQCDLLAPNAPATSEFQDTLSAKAPAALEKSDQFGYLFDSLDPFRPSQPLALDPSLALDTGCHVLSPKAPAASEASEFGFIFDSSAGLDHFLPFQPLALDASLAQDVNLQELLSPPKGPAASEAFRFGSIVNSFAGLDPFLPSHPLALEASVVQDMGYRDLLSPKALDASEALPAPLSWEEIVKVFPDLEASAEPQMFDATGKDILEPATLDNMMSPTETLDLDSWLAEFEQYYC